MSKSDKTRERLVESYTRLTRSMPYDQLTVSAITNDCGMSRQTFYYHFHSLYDLAVWECRRQLASTLSATKGASWVLRIAAILNILYEHKEIVQSITSSRVGRQDLDRLLKDELGLVAMRLLEDLFSGTDMPLSDRALIARFYTAGTVEIIEAWIDDGMREHPRRLGQRLEAVYINGIPGALKIFGAAEMPDAASKGLE